MPNSVTYIKWTPTCEWYVVICDSKNKYQKHMCLKEIGLHAPKMVPISIVSIVDIIWEVGRERHIWPRNGHKNFPFNNNQDIHMSSKICEEIDYTLNLDRLSMS